MGVYINGAWYEPPEIQAYVNDLLKQRDAYKQELIDTLRKAASCSRGEDYDCTLCPNHYLKLDYCPSGMSQYAAKLRLEELVKEKTI